MKVMVVGGGAREHTLAWKLSQSKKVSELYIAPGNAGTAGIARNLDISPTNLDALAKAAQEKKIDLMVIGPESPLAAGLVDKLQGLGIRAFGPTKEAALIESSKVFAKKLMHKYGIPCAKDAVFTSYEEAKAYVKKQPVPLVIKADGLAAGKGAIVAQSIAEALKALSDIMEARVFGDAGNRVLVEECLVGRETSLIAFTDGKTVVPMVTARDYKRARDGDMGLNTGGMGCYSPSRFLDKGEIDRAIKTIVEPVVKAMSEEGRPYKGVLYTGLMFTAEGPKVLEFNARFGDPETQAQLPLLKSDLVDIMQAIIDGSLDKAKIEWSKDACVGVVMASGGYPGNYKQGYPINGLDKMDKEILVFHAGTKENEGKICTAGGRVLTVVATGKTIADARSKAYRNVSRISFENCHYRKDIAEEA
ncbi:MAG TPA: phosphoribosylamine--glycine ligase [Dehalococcoidia bacterium]|nr:phosphoribosylamine--glycine ligase [Dehalococcoidia bacterium]